MKNAITLFVLLLVATLIPQQSKAQLYEKGDILVNAGISFGLIGYGGFGSGYSGFVPLSASVEYSINDKFGVGVFSGFVSRKYSNLYDYRFTGLSFGAKGTFHATGVLNELLDSNMDEEKLDLYASLLLGVKTYNWKYDNEGIDDLYNNSTEPLFGPTIGVRYMFNPKIGAYFETGRGTFGFAELGVSFKL